MSFKVAVLTVSDTASKDVRFDKSGPLIKDLVQPHSFLVAESRIVPDNESVVKAVVATWCSSGNIDWIITTGGTGFGEHDRTPEAIKALLEREAPGIVHLLLSSSISHTPLAALSRPVAGSIGKTLVVTLPGSTKAVKENLTCLLDSGILPHALDLLRGGSGRKVHAELAKSSPLSGTVSTDDKVPTSPKSSHHHHHHHDHQPPTPRTKQGDAMNFPASARNRISPYPLISYEQALEIIMREIPALGTEKLAVNTSLRGLILAEDVYAQHDIPRTRTTNVDGYAVRSSDKAGVYKVLTSVTHKRGANLPPGAIYRINTGAPLPEGADSVIMVEDTQLVSTAPDDPDEEAEVRTLAQVTAGENVRLPGSDVRYGALVLNRGVLLSGTGGEIGTLAFVGRKEVLVQKKPVVAILSTGDELVDISGKRNDTNFNTASTNEDWTGIWDTNRPTLQAALETLGYRVVDLGIVHDDIQAHVDKLKEGLRQADIVLTTGGTSMGASDLLKPVIERNLQGTIHFGRVTIKPGKPTTFATVPVQDSEASGSPLKKPIFALPGNPASALVCLYIFVIPALRKMGGFVEAECQLPRLRVQLMDNMRLDSRTEFHRVFINSTAQGLHAHSTGGQRSSRATSLSGANGLVILPQKATMSQPELKAGDSVDAILIGELQWK